MATARSNLRRVSILLFLSGFSALIYQTAWLREFRLIFGASTAATSAVLAIFMGGLGLGSALLGPKLDRHTNPLRFYSLLELAIAVLAASSPLLLGLVRHIYIALGGTQTLGVGFGTVVRLILSAVAIGVPAFLMGATFPAAALAATPRDDASRHTVAWLYGINTLGAVLGALAGTFFLFERWGNNLTIASAAAINGAVAFGAWFLSRTTSFAEAGKRSTANTIDTLAPAAFVYTAAAITGFVFLLMEIVWYRMLSPLLGGSAFTFGLILAFALLGIGLGGVFAVFLPMRSSRTVERFAFLCALQALALSIPYALGDRIALTTMFLRPLGSFGFFGHTLAWAAICAMVVLPAACVAGIQFPMLISLLGTGRKEIGIQTGRTYAWNAGGAIVGSLSGGFILLPMVSAPGLWKVCVISLILLGATAIVVGRLGQSFRWSGVIPGGLIGLAAVCLILTTGPTAFWRHSQLGSGRLAKLDGTRNEYRDLINSVRREVFWQAEGIESSIAMANSYGLSFLINGRSDGHSTGDADTQIMLGLLPAALHPEARKALVVGLGTGSTAGWLADVPGMQQVDVIELEPRTVEVAEHCAAVNRNALRNSRVNLIFGDGREFTLTSKQVYDLIVSEPSNPYRAGIATLFTREYYLAVAAALRPNGIFAQWVQAYDVDVPTMQTVYATIGSVFANVDTWQTSGGDLLLLATKESLFIDPAKLRQRLELEPFQEALQNAWNTTQLEGFLAHFVGSDFLARAMPGNNTRLNTDDRTVLEFSFARNIDRSRIRISELRAGARLNGTDRPATHNGLVDWEMVKRRRLEMQARFHGSPDAEGALNQADNNRAQAHTSYGNDDLETALGWWHKSPLQVEDLPDLELLAECLAEARSPEAPNYIEELRKFSPAKANAIAGRYLLQAGDFEQATRALEQSFLDLRSNPWVSQDLINRTLEVALRVARDSKSEAITLRLFRAIQQPFSVFNSEEPRTIMLLNLGRLLDQDRPSQYCLEALQAGEPHIPWQEGFLRVRSECYRNAGDPRLPQAEKDYATFLANEPKKLSALSFMKPLETKSAPQQGYATEKSAP